VWAIVPVKPFHLAKQRLAPVLSEAERAAFARAMVVDVLAAVTATPGIARTLVVTRDEGARALAREAGAEVLEETALGLVPAVTEGARAAAAAGARGSLIVPGDVPLAAPADLAAVLATHGDGPGITLVADDDGDGTNCLACTPADALDFRFGRRSADAHVAAAEAAGLPARRPTNEALALDVDVPADLEAFLARARAGAALAFLEASGIASRIRRAPGPASRDGRSSLGGRA
jgi:2-phospho-L-lactate guanylyltransferase